MGFVFIRAEPQDCVVLMYSSLCISEITQLLYYIIQHQHHFKHFELYIDLSTHQMIGFMDDKMGEKSHKFTL